MGHLLHVHMLHVQWVNILFSRREFSICKLQRFSSTFKWSISRSLGLSIVLSINILVDTGVSQNKIYIMFP